MKTAIATWATALLMPLCAGAQQVLPLDSAIARGLAHSHGIRIAQAQREAAHLRDFRGNAGETPRTAITLSDNAQLLNTEQELASGTQIARTGAVANNLGTGVGVTWTLFNGMRVQAVKGQVRAEAQQADEVLRAQVQATTADILIAYASLARQQAALRVAQQSKAVSETRLLLAQQRKDAGLGNGADLLLAQLDLHERQQAERTQRALIAQQTITLNNHLGTPLDTEWTLPDSVSLPEMPWEQIEQAIRQNPEIAAAAAATRAAEFNARATYANRLPAMQVSGGLAYNLAMNTGGFILRSQTYGPYLGLNASVPLFQRRVFNSQHSIAQQLVEVQRLREAQTLDDLVAAARSQYTLRQSIVEQARAEDANTDLARKLLDIVTARERADAATILELREAQRTFETIHFRAIDLRWQATTAHIELMRIAGLL